ncbi:ACP S-malonyltransferase [Streptomyces sp. NPDC005811]|uniref:ACP S-malonyltransferase n=1 Tax=Streptomyces sp. NPDC005811 TaxID=3154565 RepID=UPI0033FEBB08
MTYALLFPGQGAQFPGMAQRWYEKHEEVRDLFDRASERTGLPLPTLCFGTSREDQARTDWTQPCVLTASLAGLFALRAFLAERGADLAPAAVAGHSLGHFTALVAADVIDADTAVDLVHRRGEIMSTAAHRCPGAMASVIGLGLDRVRQIVADCPKGAVAVAAVNGPDQIVVSGERDALAWTLEEAGRAGAERVVPLAIGIAAHSALMAEAEEEFAQEIGRLHLAEPTVPVALNTTGTLTRDPAELRSDLLVHMTRPVLWWDGVHALRAAGVRRLLDVGPGRTLGKVLRRDLPDGEVLANDKTRGPEALLT